MQRKHLYLIYVLATLGIGFMLLSAGIGTYKLSRDDSSSLADDYELPQFVYGDEAPEHAPEAYRAAISYPEELSHIPCYCNCGSNARHKSVLDCFIDERNGDEISFDHHGAG